MFYVYVKDLTGAKIPVHKHYFRRTISLEGDNNHHYCLFSSANRIILARMLLETPMLRRLQIRGLAGIASKPDEAFVTETVTASELETLRNYVTRQSWTQPQTFHLEREVAPDGSIMFRTVLD